MPMAQADEFRLPVPGVMVRLSPPLDPPMLKGIKVHPDNPFRFDFILDQGDGSSRHSEEQSDEESLKQESTKLIKYFLASLTIPEKDLWVNLSPYEKDRIIPNSFGLTEMGRDLLAEDYMLKQITASLIYPEDAVGKKFWKRIYAEAAKRYGTTDIPVNTFNKVWIIPDKAVVYENAKAGTAYVVESKLKVMLEEDYLSIQKHNLPPLFFKEGARGSSKNINSLGSQIIREIVIPELTKEVNENKNFAQLRQVYNSLILATWYKKKIKDSILEQVYADKSKVAGVNIDNPKEKDKIYQQYLKAFKKGVYNYIKEDIDPATQETIPRKYFSGGLELDMDATTVNSGKTIQYIKQLPSWAMMSINTLSKSVILSVLVAAASFTSVKAVENVSQPNQQSIVNKVEVHLTDNAPQIQILKQKYGSLLVDRVLSILGNPKDFKSELMRVIFNAEVSDISNKLKPLTLQDQEYILSLFETRNLPNDLFQKTQFNYAECIALFIENRQVFKEHLIQYQDFLNQGEAVRFLPAQVDEFVSFSIRHKQLGEEFFHQIYNQHKFLWEYKPRSSETMDQVKRFIQGTLADQSKRARSIDPESVEAVQLLTINLLSHMAFMYQLNPYSWDAYRDILLNILINTHITTEVGMRYNASADNMVFGSKVLQQDKMVLSGLIFHELGHRKSIFGALRLINSDEYNFVAGEMVADFEPYINLGPLYGSAAVTKYREFLEASTKNQLRVFNLTVVMSPKQSSSNPQQSKDKEQHYFSRLQNDNIFQALGGTIDGTRFNNALNDMEAEYTQNTLPADVRKELFPDTDQRYNSTVHFTQNLMMKYFSGVGHNNINDLQLRYQWYDVNKNNQIVAQGNSGSVTGAKEGQVRFYLLSEEAIRQIRLYYKNQSFPKNRTGITPKGKGIIEIDQAMNTEIVNQTSLALEISGKLNSSNPLDRQEALENISHHANSGIEFLESILRNVNDPSPAIRLAAYKALGKIADNPRAFEAILQGVNDSDVDVQKEAIRALAHENIFDKRKAIRVLSQHVYLPDLQNSLLNTLAVIGHGHQEALEAIAGMSGIPDLEFPVGLVLEKFIMGHADSHRAMEILYRNYQERPQAFWSYQGALENIGASDPLAVDILCDMLSRASVPDDLIDTLAWHTYQDKESKAKAIAILGTYILQHPNQHGVAQRALEILGNHETGFVQEVEPIATRPLMISSTDTLLEDKDWGRESNFVAGQEAHNGFSLFELKGMPVYFVNFLSSFGQAAALDRIAVFIEHHEFKGQILPWAKMGLLLKRSKKPVMYTGHNYALEDIARFFTMAFQSNTLLNNEEKKFRDWLINQGLMSFDGQSAYSSPPSAFLISFSQDLSLDLKIKVLRHEMSHALYALNADYRREVGAIFDSLPPGIKDFVKSVLYLQGYDVFANENLLKTEFGAYFQDPQSLINILDGKYKRSRGAGENPIDAKSVWVWQKIREFYNTRGSLARDGHLEAQLKPEVVSVLTNIGERLWQLNLDVQGQDYYTRQLRGQYDLTKLPEKSPETTGLAVAKVEGNTIMSYDPRAAVSDVQISVGGSGSFSTHMTDFSSMDRNELMQSAIPELVEASFKKGVIKALDDAGIKGNFRMVVSGRRVLIIENSQFRILNRKKILAQVDQLMDWDPVIVVFNKYGIRYEYRWDSAQMNSRQQLENPAMINILKQFNQAVERGNFAQAEIILKIMPGASAEQLSNLRAAFFHRKLVLDGRRFNLGLYLVEPQRAYYWLNLREKFFVPLVRAAGLNPEKIAFPLSSSSVSSIATTHGEDVELLTWLEDYYGNGHMSDAQMGYVFAHEIAHIKNGSAAALDEAVERENEIKDSVAAIDIMLSAGYNHEMIQNEVVPFIANAERLKMKAISEGGLKLSSQVHAQIQATHPYEEIAGAIQKHLSNLGGIDLTPANMNVQIKTRSPTKAFGDDNGRMLDDNEGIKFHLNPAMLALLQNAPGFEPKVISILPLKSLPEFLGIQGNN